MTFLKVYDRMKQNNEMVRLVAKLCVLVLPNIILTPGTYRLQSWGK